MTQTADNQLEQLDREWTARREQLMSTGKPGRRQAPRFASAFIGMVVGVVFLLLLVAVTISANTPFVFPLLGLIGIVAVIYGGIRRINKADQYAREEQRYLDQRRRILNPPRDA